MFSSFGGGEPTSLGGKWLARSGRSLSVLGDRISSALPPTPGLPGTPSFGPAGAGSGGIGSRANKPYDEPNFQNELLSRGIGNGVRVWYDSYTTIDWIHDAIKESHRLRRLRAVKGVRGALLNAWDRAQGWLIVTFTGIITAFIAGAVVQSEAALFDFKDGYCQRDWRLAKRFCCPYANQPDYDRPLMVQDTTPRWTYKSAFSGMKAQSGSAALLGYGSNMLAGWAAPVAGSPAWAKLANTASLISSNASSPARLGALNLASIPVRPFSESESCPGWITWSEKLSASGVDSWVGDYGAYILIAVSIRAAWYRNIVADAACSARLSGLALRPCSPFT